MNKRNISEATQRKVLRAAAEILFMHGSIAGDRICQDWSGERDKNPKDLFTAEERDDLEYNHQIHNSRLEDYIAGDDGFDDEMSVSFTLADALLDMAGR